MKTVLKQLFYMNLSLLMAVLLILPAVAEETEEPQEPEEYTLTLHANWAEDETLALTNAPETAYTLADYIFRRDSYVQVAWADAADGEATQRLNALYVPATSTDLYAFWLEAGAGQIVLNGLQGDLDAQGTFYQKYDTAVTLPAELTYPEASDTLLAWSTEAAPQADAQGVLSGLWYSGGDEILPDLQRMQELYGHGTGGDAFVIYHPAKGGIARGGSILVQRAQESELTLLDGNLLLAPEGYHFAGWARESTVVPSSVLTLQPGEVVYLRAVWEPDGAAVTPEEGIIVTAEGGRVTAELSPAWCQQTEAEKAVLALYDSDWKMLKCGVGRLQPDGSILIELEYTDYAGLNCRIFTVDGDWLPLWAAVPFTLPGTSS